MNSETLFYIIVGIILVDFIFDKILDSLNAHHFDDPIPPELSDVYDKTEYEKSQRYKKERYKFGILTSGFSLLLTLGFLFFDGFEWVDTIARGFSNNEIFIALIFFGIIMIGSDILTTPFSYYSTFVIEEKYGFNKTSKSTFFVDKIKGWLLMAILGGGILALIIWFYQFAGADFWWYAWILIAVFSIFLNMFYAKLVVPLFNKQSPLENGSLRTKIENYAQSVGFKLDNIFIIDGSKRSTKANAYFSGFGSEKRITLFDTLGVDIPSFHIGLIAFGILYSPISEITGLLMNLISRKFEYQADNYAKHTYNSKNLISSLKKLSKNSLSNLTPHRTYVFWHYSHPSLLQRYKNLMN